MTVPVEHMHITGFAELVVFPSHLKPLTIRVNLIQVYLGISCTCGISFKLVSVHYYQNNLVYM